MFQLFLLKILEHREIFGGILEIDDGSYLPLLICLLALSDSIIVTNDDGNEEEIIVERKC